MGLPLRSRTDPQKPGNRGKGGGLKAIVITQPVRLGLKELAEAQLEIDETAVPWGRSVTGTLIFRGLRGVHRVTQSVVATLDLWSDERYELLGSATLLRGGVSIAAGETVGLPLCIEMPWGVPFQSPCQIAVTVRSGLWSQAIRAAVQAAPPVACRMAAEQFAQAACMRAHRWEFTQQGVVLVDLLPDREPHLLRRARLRLMRAGEEDWYGELALSARSDWRGAVTLGVPFLAKEREAVQEQFRALLWDAGVSAGMEWSLPLPAEPPLPAGHDLPTPAGLPGGTPVDLPLPAEPAREGPGFVD